VGGRDGLARRVEEILGMMAATDSIHDPSRIIPDTSKPATSPPPPRSRSVSAQGWMNI